jgi:hypothetical protein
LVSSRLKVTTGEQVGVGRVTSEGSSIMPADIGGALGGAPMFSASLCNSTTPATVPSIFFSCHHYKALHFNTDYI